MNRRDLLRGILFTPLARAVAFVPVIGIPMAKRIDPLSFQEMVDNTIRQHSAQVRENIESYNALLRHIKQRKEVV